MHECGYQELHRTVPNLQREQDDLSAERKMQPHSRPTRPWAKVGIDMFSLDKRNFLITVDYWSNYFQLDQIIGNTTSKKVVQCLRRHFAALGIPDTVIWDNGPQFVLEDFKKFSMEWMFNHVTTNPYHSQSNGRVESLVKIAKNILRTSMTANEEPWLAILAFRNTQTEGMATSPATATDVQKNQDTHANGRTSPFSWFHRSGNRYQRSSTEARETGRVLQHNVKGFARLHVEVKVGDEVWVKPHTLGQKKMEKSNCCYSTYWTSFLWYSDEHRRNFKTKQSWSQWKPRHQRQRRAGRRQGKPWPECWRATTTCKKIGRGQEESFRQPKSNAEQRSLSYILRKN